MAHGVDMSNPNAWDDSFLVNSWNDALKEYQKYHSIHKSGKRLEDALSEEELKELRKDYGDDVDETDATPGAAQTNGTADLQDTDMIHAETNGVGNHVPHAEAQHKGPESSEQQESKPAPQDATFSSGMPQALLGSVQDENLKNIMMSWYYAGYYTGLHAGQQAQKDVAPKQ